MIARMVHEVVGERPREQRTNLFVMATLYCDAGSAPVKLRNLSSTGAMIEGGLIPATGTKVRLSRGSLNIVGKVVWSRSERAGLRLDSSILVSEWLPGGRAAAAQQRIDEIVQHAKTSNTAGAESTSTLLASPAAEVVSASDLMRLSRALDALAEDLADDPAAVERHGSKLQTLDLVAQMFAKLAARG